MIRPATPDDAPAVCRLIRALAEYEHLSHAVTLDEGRLREHLFGPRPFVETLLAEEAGEVVGYALFFPTYSTFLGLPGLYLEDLFVLPEFRGRGHGKSLLAATGVDLGHRHACLDRLIFRIKSRGLFELLERLLRLARHGGFFRNNQVIEPEPRRERKGIRPFARTEQIAVWRRGRGMVGAFVCCCHLFAILVRSTLKHSRLIHHQHRLGH